MATFDSIQNVHLLISHRTTYGTSRTISDILSAPVSRDLLCLLSVLSFANDEEKRFRTWSRSSLPAASKQPTTSANNECVVFGRLQIFECWKQLLVRVGTLQVAKQNRMALAGVLHELFAKINDQKNEGDHHQFLAKSSIQFARDDYIYKLYRAQKVFLDGTHVAPHVAAFEKKNGFTVKMYLHVIFMIISRCHLMRKVTSFEPENIDKWFIDLNQISSDLQIDLAMLKRIMSELSFTIDDVSSDKKDDYSFQLFRNRPFLQLSDTCFLPIEGRLVEELLFDNLLHRLHQAAGIGMQFYADVGHDFEGYVQGLIEKFCSTTNDISYEYIPEFKFEHSNSLSPDAMVRCEADKTVVAFEVKAARYLDSILTSEDTPQVVADSFEKLRFKPWKQVHSAIERIVGEKRHGRLTEGLSYLFVAVTMNEIPHSLQDYKIEIHGVDRSYCFYSFGVHSLELLLIAASASKKYSLYDILRNAFNLRHKISNRTTFIRFCRREEGESEFDKQIRIETSKRLTTI
ncbi:hypothetical protein [Achromobacter mucicolens]|uniref:hypothetical protein n=1 Tax=Achromobacter mucicolens TaxID=1389922 RepID=UPI0022F390B4|nr:hypothetical protein [Achromobacter mucicolens]WBX89127.1 hypothetical protein PE062_00330 [Achromobacter mucicolens]